MTVGGCTEDENVVFGSAMAVGGRTEDEKVVFGSAAAAVGGVPFIYFHGVDL